MENPFHITVYDKAFNRLGWIDAPVSQTWTPRHNQQSTGQIIVMSGTDQAAMLATDGCRVVVEYRDEFLMSGPVRLLRAEGNVSNRLVTAEVQDDYRLLQRMLAWPLPDAAIGSQVVEYDKRSGAAETVLKGYVAANVERLALPVTVAASLGRGSTIAVQARMQPLTDVLVPLVDTAGIGVTVRQSGAGLVVDCYTPTTWPLPLSEESGTLSNLSWSRNPPAATRVVVGGPGEGAARLFRARVNSSAEAAYADVIEEFIDARDIKADDPNRNALMDARGNEHLAASAANAGLSLTLQEGEIFRYGGRGIHVGDRVPVELSPGVVVTDVVRSATLGLSISGPVATPVVGERTDDPNVLLVKQVSKALREVRTLKAR